MVGEEDGGLSGRIARPDQIHIVSLRQTGVAACRTVVDTGADESIDRIDLEAPPLHAHRENDRPRPENVASIQRDGHVGRVDGFDPAGHDDLSAQPLRLLQRPAREFVPGDAVWEPRVVLDPGRGAGLPARGEGLDQPRLQALGGAVDRRRQTRRPAAHDHHVVVAPGLARPSVQRPWQRHASSGQSAECRRAAPPPDRGRVRRLRLRCVQQRQDRLGPGVRRESGCDEGSCRSRGLPGRGADR